MKKVVIILLVNFIINPINAQKGEEREREALKMLDKVYSIQKKVDSVSAINHPFTVYDQKKIYILNSKNQIIGYLYFLDIDSSLTKTLNSGSIKRNNLQKR